MSENDHHPPIVLIGLSNPHDDSVPCLNDLSRNSSIPRGNHDPTVYYDIKDQLGEGSFCKVYKALYKPTQEIIAVKVIKKKRVSQADQERMIFEAQLLKQLDHPNIVKYKHIHEIKGKIYLGMELVQGGRLTDLIKDRFYLNQGRFTDKEASGLMKSILSAVEYMHSKGIVHRDLKPDNILVQDRQDMSTCKVVDFGLSAKYKLTDGMDQQCGTAIYMAPEVVAYNNEYTKKVDIWSLGIIMHEVLTGGKHPLYIRGEDSIDSYKQKLMKADKLDVSPEFSWLAKSLFMQLTTFSSKQRYSATLALKHPWITRKKEGEIPISLNDQFTNLSYQQILKEKMSLLYFLSIFKNSNKEHFQITLPALNVDQVYKTKVMKVTSKIERWHQKMKLKKQGSFHEDCDFIEMGDSPNRFDSSSDEESFFNQTKDNEDMVILATEGGSFGGDPMMSVTPKNLEATTQCTKGDEGGPECDTARENGNTRKSHQTFTSQVFKASKKRHRELFINSKMANAVGKHNTGAPTAASVEKNSIQRIGSTSLPSSTGVSPEKLFTYTQLSAQKAIQDGRYRFNFQPQNSSIPIKVQPTTNLVPNTNAIDPKLQASTMTSFQQSQITKPLVAQIQQTVSIFEDQKPPIKTSHSEERYSPNKSSKVKNKHYEVMLIKQMSLQDQLDEVLKDNKKCSKSGAGISQSPNIKQKKITRNNKRRTSNIIEESEQISLNQSQIVLQNTHIQEQLQKNVVFNKQTVSNQSRNTNYQRANLIGAQTYSNNMQQNRLILIRSNLPSKRKAEILEQAQQKQLLNGGQLATTGYNFNKNRRMSREGSLHSSNKLQNQNEGYQPYSQQYVQPLQFQQEVVKLPSIAQSPTKTQQLELKHNQYSVDKDCFSKTTTNLNSNTYSHQEQRTRQVQNQLTYNENSNNYARQKISDMAPQSNNSVIAGAMHQSKNESSFSRRLSNASPPQNQNKSDQQPQLNLVLNIQSITPTKVIVKKKKKQKDQQDNVTGGSSTQRIERTSISQDFQKILGAQQIVQQPFSRQQAVQAYQTTNVNNLANDAVGFLDPKERQQIVQLAASLRRSTNLTANLGGTASGVSIVKTVGGKLGTAASSHSANKTFSHIVYLPGTSMVPQQQPAQSYGGVITNTAGINLQQNNQYGSRNDGRVIQQQVPLQQHQQFVRQIQQQTPESVFMNGNQQDKEAIIHQQKLNQIVAQIKKSVMEGTTAGAMQQQQQKNNMIRQSVNNTQQFYQASNNSHSMQQQIQKQSPPPQQYYHAGRIIKKL